MILKDSVFREAAEASTTSSRSTEDSSATVWMEAEQRFPALLWFLSQPGDSLWVVGLPVEHKHQSLMLERTNQPFNHFSALDHWFC